MPRLRATVALSALALAAGIGGTQWLSGRSADEPLAFSSTAAAGQPGPRRHRPRTVSPASHAHVLAKAPRADVSRRPRSRMEEIAGIGPHGRTGGQAATAVHASPPVLVPLDMPVIRDLAYDQLRGHLDGQVVMRISVDGGGHVIAASVARPSGDAVLDEHALRSVRGWRFAVPPDQPDGFGADLPMRFSSRDEPVASVP